MNNMLPDTVNVSMLHVLRLHAQHFLFSVIYIGRACLTVNNLYGYFADLYCFPLGFNKTRHL